MVAACSGAVGACYLLLAPRNNSVIFNCMTTIIYLMLALYDDFNYETTEQELQKMSYLATL